MTLERLSKVLDLKPYPVLATLNRMLYHYEPTSQLEALLLK